MKVTHKIETQEDKIDYIMNLIDGAWISNKFTEADYTDMTTRFPSILDQIFNIEDLDSDGLTNDQLKLYADLHLKLFNRYKLAKIKTA